MRNMDDSFNKEESIEYTVEINQKHRERIVIRDLKWSVILEMLQLACYNFEIDQRTGEMKIMRCSEEYEKQQRLKQEKLGQQKQKKEERKEEEEKKERSKRKEN